MVCLKVDVSVLCRQSAVSSFKLDGTYEGWNFNSGNYLFTTDTK